MKHSVFIWSLFLAALVTGIGCSAGPNAHPVVDGDAGQAPDAGPVSDSDGGQVDARPDGGPSTDAGPFVDAGADSHERCEISGDTCVHAGAGDAYCCAASGTAIDPTRSCVRDHHKVYFCELIPNGCPAPTAGACYQISNDSDGGVQEYAVSYNEWPSDVSAAPCDEATATRLGDASSLPDCN